MSSSIQVQRVCQHCGNEFTARTTVTRYCSQLCGSRAHKARKRAEKVEQTNKQTEQIKNRTVEELKSKEILTVREVAQLLNCSVRSAYYYIEMGTIKSTNLGQRITRVKRSDIDKLFDQPKNAIDRPELKRMDKSECYTITEALDKFKISPTALQNLIKRNNIPKYKEGRFTYVSKSDIDKLLS